MTRLSKAYLSWPVRGAMAGLASGLGAAGEVNLSVAGAAINFVDAALATHMSGRLEANRQEISDRTDARLQQLEESGRLDEKVLQDPHFHAVVFQATIAAAQESETEKIDWYAAILAGAASTERPADMNVRALLSTMSFLTADELRLAREFYEDFHQSNFAIVDGAPTPSWGPDTSLYLRRLESANLIVSQVVDALPARFQGTAGNYFVTSTFHRLMELVRQTDGPQPRPSEAP
jgi:hypothetical protein